jgi:hypothetical protein
VLITGVTDTHYNGSFIVASVPNTTHFTYALTHANEGETADVGGTVSGGIAPTYFSRMHGVISKVEYPTATTVRISGFDYAQVLTDYVLQENLDLNFSGTRAFALADGANIVSNGTFDTDLTGWSAYNGLITNENGGHSGKCMAVATDPNITDTLG